MTGLCLDVKLAYSSTPFEKSFELTALHHVFVCRTLSDFAGLIGISSGSYSHSFDWVTHTFSICWFLTFPSLNTSGNMSYEWFFK